MSTPRTLFAYLNIEHPMVAWEVAIGRLQSVDEITVDRFGISLWAYSLLRSYVYKNQPFRFENEIRLECERMKNHSNSVSRLQGLYFFESEWQAEVSLDRWHMPHFKKYVSPVRFYPTALTEIDSEWITLNLGTNPSPEWMNKYWSGKTAGVKPLTEVLALGTGYVLNEDLRIEAYKRIYKLWPTSTPLLAAACCGFDRCGLNNVAQVRPGLVAKNDVIHGDYYIYMKEFDEHQPDIMKAVEECKRAGDFPPLTMPADSAHIFTLPDLRPYSFEFHNNAASASFASIHSGY